MQPGEPLTDLVLITLSFRLGSHRQHRGREPDGIEHDLLVLVAKRIASSRLAQFGNARDVAGAHIGHCDLLLAFDEEDLAETLGLVFAGVVHLRIGPDHARVDAEHGYLAHVWVGHGLKYKGGERLALIRPPLRFLFGVRQMAVGNAAPHR